MGNWYVTNFLLGQEYINISISSRSNLYTFVYPNRTAYLSIEVYNGNLEK